MSLDLDSMNTKNHLLSGLDEARDALEGLFSEIEKADNWSTLMAELGVGMMTLYGKLNITWNRRLLDDGTIDNASDEQVEKWFQFPRDLL